VGVFLRVTPQNCARIQYGMRRAQVEAILGYGNYKDFGNGKAHQSFSDPIPAPRPVISVQYRNGFVVTAEFISFN
jgi:hypothetical protein